MKTEPAIEDVYKLPHTRVNEIEISKVQNPKKLKLKLKLN